MNTQATRITKRKARPLEVLAGSLALIGISTFLAVLTVGLFGVNG